MMEIERVTCVKFEAKPSSMTSGYLLITAKNPGCYAYVGYLGAVLPHVQMVLNLQKENWAKLDPGCYVSSVTCKQFFVGEWLKCRTSEVQIPLQPV